MADRLEGRPHDPDIRELTAIVDGQKELFSREIESIHKLIYEQKDRTKEAIASLKDQIQLALAASDKAVDKAENGADKWRANANEWRAAMGDRDAKFATKETVDRELTNLRVAVAELRRSRDENSGQHVGSGTAWGYVATAIAVAGTLIATAIALIRVGARG